MPTYTVSVETDGTCAETEVEADDIDSALAKARDIDTDDLLFQPFTDPFPVNAITVTDGNGAERAWRDPELRVRLVADDLLIAAENLLTALALWMVSTQAEKIVRSTAGTLQEVVDRAQGRRP